MATIRQGQQTLSKECNDIIYLHRLHKKIMENQEKNIEPSNKNKRKIGFRPGQQTLSRKCTDIVYMHRLLKDVREKGEKNRAEIKAWREEYNRKHGIVEE